MSKNQKEIEEINLSMDYVVFSNKQLVLMTVLMALVLAFVLSGCTEAEAKTKAPQTKREVFCERVFLKSAELPPSHMGYLHCIEDEGKNYVK
jgi:hypothetical protein